MKLFLRTVLLIIVSISSHSALAYDHTYKSYNEILKQVVAVKGHQSFVDSLNPIQVNLMNLQMVLNISEKMNLIHGPANNRWPSLSMHITRSPFN